MLLRPWLSPTSQRFPHFTTRSSQTRFSAPTGINDLTALSLCLPLPGLPRVRRRRPGPCMRHVRDVVHQRPRLPEAGDWEMFSNFNLKTKS
jgi:hypothetical protein